MSNTIKDIAKELGISPSTVSRALSDNKNISEATKKKVRKVAKKLNYQKNTWASALRTKQTKLVGVIVPSLKNPFFAHTISGMQQVANQEGLRVVICQSNEDPEVEMAQLYTLVASGAECIVVSITENTISLKHFKEVEEQGVPIIFFDRGIDEKGFNQVEAGDFESGKIATEHLISQGCKNIVHLAGPSNLKNSRRRKEGYMAALAAHDIPFNEQLVIETGYETIGFKDLWIDKILSENLKVDGIFAVSDPIAISAMVRLQKRGVKVPEQIKIIGFGRDDAGEWVNPSLSTVTQMPEKMGRATIEMFLEIKKTGVGNKLNNQKIMESKIIIRDSSQ
ncbi:MAG: LacI family transcriptional regulator [Marivirga sp.]|jgi:LacI family transcriptional regulator